MAKTSIGKKWEDVFKQSWKKTFPNTFIFRLKDNMNGFKETSGNPCDFICFPGSDKLFMVECKEHLGASIPFIAIPQYERLLEYKNIQGVFPGIVLWLSEKDLVLWISINDLEKMVLAGEKSVGVRMLKNTLYNIIEIPFVKKRVYPDADYSILLKLTEGGTLDG